MPVDPSRPNVFQALMPKLAAAKLANQRILHIALEGAREELTQVILRKLENVVKKIDEGRGEPGERVTVDFTSLGQQGAWRKEHPGLTPKHFDNRGLMSLATMGLKATSDEEFRAIFFAKVGEPIMAELIEAGFVEPRLEPTAERKEHFVNDWGQAQRRRVPASLRFSVQVP